MQLSSVPKIELHVHLEATVRPKDLFEMASRNGYALPADNEQELAELYRFRDFEHFLELWMMTTPAIQKYRDFRQVVVAYAQEAASHGAVYIEGIFTPIERISGGASWDEVFSGFCDGALEARELFGVEVRLTTDIPRILGLDVALETARYAIKYRDRGVVGLGLGGPEAHFRPNPSRRRFGSPKRRARLGPTRRRGGRSGIDTRRFGRSTSRSDQTRHPGGGGQRVASRTRSQVHRLRRMPGVQSAYAGGRAPLQSTHFPGCWRRVCSARSAPMIRRCSIRI